MFLAGDVGQSIFLGVVVASGHGQDRNNQPQLLDPGASNEKGYPFWF